MVGKVRVCPLGTPKYKTCYYILYWERDKFRKKNHGKDDAERKCKDFPLYSD